MNGQSDPARTAGAFRSVDALPALSVCAKSPSMQVVVDCEVEHLAIVLLGIYGLPPSAPIGDSKIGRRLHVLGIYGLPP